MQKSGKEWKGLFETKTNVRGGLRNKKGRGPADATASFDAKWRAFPRQPLLARKTDDEERVKSTILSKLPTTRSED